MTSTPIDELDMPTLDLTDPQTAARPFDAVRDLAKESWIARTPAGYALLHWTDVNAVYRDRRFRVPLGMGLPEQGVHEGRAFDWVNSTVLGLEGDDHGRIRRLCQPAFSPAKVQTYRPIIHDVLQRIVQPVEARGRADAANGWLESLSVRVICAVLGFPEQDWQTIAHLTTDINRIMGFHIKEDLPMIETAIEQLDSYIHSQLEIRRTEGNPGANLGAALIAAEEQGDRLSNHELVSLFETLLLAGGDNTRDALTTGLWLFARRPEDWQSLADDPTLVPSAVDELLRYRPSFVATWRTSLEQLSLRNAVVQPGTYFLLTVAAANMDPSVYEDAGTFDIRRYCDPSTRIHHTLGAGPHHCLGAHLAKLELQEVFTYLPRRLRNLTVDEDDSAGVEWDLRSGVHGPTRLPLRWQPPAQ